MKEQDYLDIEAYLQGELSPAAATTLEARAATDPAFAAALAGRRTLNDHLRADAGESALRDALAILGAKYFSETDSAISPTTTTQAGPPNPPEEGGARVKKLLPRKNRILLISLAAAIILLLVFGGRVFFDDAGAAYDQFAQHQPLSLTERGDGDNGISAVEAAYNDGRYEEAIARLTEYIAENKDDARARLALGVSFLETGNITEAKRVLTEVAGSGGSVAPYGNWYLALANVRSGDKSAALSYLDRIPAGDPFLDERIMELRQVIAE